MNSRNQTEESEALAAVAAKFRRFVEYFPWWASYAMGMVAVIAIVFGMSVDSNPPDVYDVLFLGGIALAWIALSAFWAKLAKSSIKSHGAMIDEYEHLFAYVMEMNIIVKDSLEALSVYDGDRAIELARDLNSLATKSLYDSFWRGDPREESEVEHE